MLQAMDWHIVAHTMYIRGGARTPFIVWCLLWRDAGVFLSNWQFYVAAYIRTSIGNLLGRHQNHLFANSWLQHIIIFYFTSKMPVRCYGQISTILFFVATVKCLLYYFLNNNFFLLTFCIAFNESLYVLHISFYPYTYYS